MTAVTFYDTACPPRANPEGGLSPHHVLHRMLTAAMSFAVYLYALKNKTEEKGPGSVEVVATHLRFHARRRVSVRPVASVCSHKANWILLM